MQEQFLDKVKLKANQVGGYASSFRACGEMTLHVDGVGTKTLLLRKYSRNWVAGWDCLMVNANDIACEGFKAEVFVDYLATERGDPGLAEEIAEGLSRASEELGAVMAGGETAIMPDVVRGYDISCTVLGRRAAEPSRPEPGDKVIAVSSTGPHANGYTLIRKLIDAGLLDPEPLLDFLLAPVANYHNPLLEAMKEGLVKWGAHVTGGAFFKVHSRLPKGLGIRLECWEIPKGFLEIVEAAGIGPEEAYKTFNMGIGLIAVGSEDAVEIFRRAGLEAWVAGEVVEGPSEICTPWGKLIIR